MVKPEKCGYLHLVYHFTIPLKNKAAFLTHDQNKSLIKGQYSLTRIVFYNYFDYFCEKLSFWFHLSSNKFCSKDNMVWPLGKCLCWVFWILLIVKLTFNIVYILLSHLFVLLYSIHSCLPVCQSYFNGWFRSQGKYRATLEFKGSGCAVITQSKLHFVHPPPFLQGGGVGGGEPPAKFLKRGFDRASTFSGGLLGKRGIQIGKFYLRI